MTALIRRHLALYFNNKASVFFSLMGAWIAFALYILFLQKNMQDAWSGLAHPEKFLDKWVMGGVLAVTSITTTWSGAARLVRDKESQKFADFLLTDISPLKLNLSYLISTSIIGAAMQLFMYAIMSLYFSWQDDLRFEASSFPKILGVILLSAVMAAVLNVIILQFIHSLEVAERLAVIIGTASGFLVGVYMPVGGLPTVAQHLIKLTPEAYVASAFREILIGNGIPQWQSSQNIKEYLGISLKVNGHLLTLSQDLLLVSAVFLVGLMLLALLQLVKRPLLR